MKISTFYRTLVILLLQPIVLLAAPSSVFAHEALLPADPDWFRIVTLFVAKLHPVIVHLPIGIFAFVALLEVYHLCRRAKKTYQLESSVYPYTLAALVSVAAVGAGILSAESEEFLGELKDIVFLHQWGGIAVSIISLIIALLGLRSLRNPKLISLYRFLALATIFLVGFVAHLGGLLVHGADYYSEIFELSKNGPVTETTTFVAGEMPPAINRKVSFSKDIHPILEHNCFKCHGNGKRKGDFSVDNREAFLKGGKTKPAVEVGRSDLSYAIELVSGMVPKKTMPSKGRKLTEEEIGTLRAWIDQGFEWDKDSKHEFQRTPKVPTDPRTPELPDGQGNPVDLILAQYNKEKNLLPLEQVDDRVFAKRVYLDVLGVIPSVGELTSFLQDKGADKREKLVDSLLSDKFGYATNWMTFWNDALRNDYSGPGFLLGGRKEITKWLYRSLVNNKPFDQFVSELVNPTPQTVGFVRGIRWWQGAAVNANEEPGMQTAQNVAQVFMGINLKCASCHSSFTDEWTLTDSYGFANLVGSRSLVTHECNVSTDKKVEPRFLYPELGSITARGRSKRRQQLAELITSERNGRFARTFVNRLWQKFFGVGIVEPIDELDNPPWSQDLLDWLASEFVTQKYDVKAMIRLILTSKAYQAKSVGASEHYKNFVFHGPVVRRMDVEPFLDSIAKATNVVPAALPGDIERTLSVSLSAFNRTSPKDKNAPRILFKSGHVVDDTPAIEVNANIEGAKNVWLIALRGYKVESKLEALQKQFDKVAKQDDGQIDVLDQSLKDRRIAKDHNKKAHAPASERNVELADYRAFWLKPMAIDEHSKKFALDNSESWTPSYYMENDFDGDGVDDPNSPKVVFSDSGIETKAFSAIRFNVEGKNLKRLQAKVDLIKKSEGDGAEVEFWVVADLPVRSVFLEATEFMLAMGRPRREQITTRRDPVTSTMQAFELLNGEGLSDLLDKSVAALKVSLPKDPQLITADLYKRMLGREPTKEEEVAAISVIDANSESGIRDLLWILTALPEFQLIV